MPDTNPPYADPDKPWKPELERLGDQVNYLRRGVEGMSKELGHELRAQTSLQREILGVLRDLHTELEYLRTTSERLVRLERALEKAAATGG